MERAKCFSKPDRRPRAHRLTHRDLQGIRVQWLRAAGAMLTDRLVRQSFKRIGRRAKSLIPRNVTRHFRHDGNRERVLLSVRQQSNGAKGFFEELGHIRSIPDGIACEPPSGN